MSTLTQVSELLGHHHHGQADARLILDFEARSKSRQRAQLADGEAVALMLPARCCAAATGCATAGDG